MDAEVFIYGTPIGNCFYGKADEKIYFDTFYNGEKDDFLAVKIRKAGDNKLYCYYNYLIYQNVIGKNGRPGSFFGITLRLDAYCLDLKSIYRILDVTFNTYVRGVLFENVSGNFRYIVDDFNDTSKLELIKNFIIDLFLRTFKDKANTCFAQINHTFVVDGGKLYAINLYDYSDENIFRLMKETGQIRISPYYPTQEISRQQQQYDKRLEEIYQQHESDKKIDSEEKNRLSNSLLESNSKIKKLQTELEQKNKDIEQLNGKIRNIERAKEFEHLIEQIKVPIEKISEYIESMAPVITNGIVETGRKWYSRFFEIVRKSIPFINMILMLVVLLCVSKDIQLNSSSDESARLTEEMNNLRKQKEELEKQLEVLCRLEKGITIDIVNLKEKTLKKKHTYDIMGILKEDFFQWEVEGANKKKGKDGRTCLTVTKDTVRIRLLMNEKMVTERTILSR